MSSCNVLMLCRYIIWRCAVVCCVCMQACEVLRCRMSPPKKKKVKKHILHEVCTPCKHAYAYAVQSPHMCYWKKDYGHHIQLDPTQWSTTVKIYAHTQSRHILHYESPTIPGIQRVKLGAPLQTLGWQLVEEVKATLPLLATLPAGLRCQLGKAQHSLPNVGNLHKNSVRSWWWAKEMNKTSWKQW